MFGPSHSKNNEHVFKIVKPSTQGCRVKFVKTKSHRIVWCVIFDQNAHILNSNHHFIYLLNKVAKITLNCRMKSLNNR